MDISVETHLLVVDNHGHPIVENEQILLQAKNDESYVYTPLTSHIKEIFEINVTEMSVEANLEISGSEHVLCENETVLWNHSSILLLLDEYKKRSQKFRNPKLKKKLLWEEISQAMKQNGYTVDADSLDRKLRNMKNTYRTILDNNNKKKSTGKGRIQWQYFNIFEEIFRDDKTVNPTPVMSSTKEILSPNISSLNQAVTSAVASPQTSPTTAGNKNVIPLLYDSASYSSSSCSIVSTPTSSQKYVHSKQLDRFRKRQLEIEEEKLVELKRIREAIDKSNCIQERKTEILESLIQNRNSQ